MIDRDALLARIPLFEHLEPEVLRTLASHLAEVRLPSGRLLFDQGDPGDSAYVVLRGRVRVFLANSTGEAITLASLGPGELFGEVSLLDEGPRTAGAMADEETDLLVIDREDLREILVRHPSSALDLLTVMGRRIRDANARLRSGPVGVDGLPSSRGPSSALTSIFGSVSFLIVPVALLGWWIVEVGRSDVPSWLVPSLSPVLVAILVLLIQVTLLLGRSLRREEAQHRQAQALENALILLEAATGRSSSPSSPTSSPPVRGPR